MRRSLMFSIMLGLAMVAGSPSRDAHADAARPPVSIVQARKVALARVPGTIVNEKLKHKNKPPIWSIKIRPRGVAADSDQLTKIEIDADTAKIVKVKDVKPRKTDDE